MAETLIHIFNKILDFLFPKKCLGCGTRNVFLCDNCLKLLPLIEAPLFGIKIDGVKEIFASTYYESEIVKKAIRLLKYHGIKSLAKPLANLIYLRLGSAILENAVNPNKSLMIPIPLSQNKLRKRGYNQTKLIGQTLSDKLSISFNSNVLYKIRETLSQVEIKDRSKRIENMLGAFMVKNPEAVKGKNIILVDDIVTTGATLKDAARALKQAGAKKIIAVVVAKG